MEQRSYRLVRVLMLTLSTAKTTPTVSLSYSDLARAGLERRKPGLMSHANLYIMLKGQVPGQGRPQDALWEDVKPAGAG